MVENPGGECFKRPTIKTDDAIVIQTSENKKISNNSSWIFRRHLGNVETAQICQQSKQNWDSELIHTDFMTLFFKNKIKGCYNFI